MRTGSRDFFIEEVQYERPEELSFGQRGVKMSEKARSHRRYKQKTVYDAANDRIAYIFKNFPKIYVSFSGGKARVILEWPNSSEHFLTNFLHH